MGWLGQGLTPLTEARWSAGAIWADASSPSASDTDWVDETAWDTAHAYDADAQIQLGVFIEGVDVTAETRALSWQLGQSDLLPTAIQPGSASLSLKSTEPDYGDRVVIFTEWDVLWAGFVESVTTTERVGAIDTIEVEATDDLARASRYENEAITGGSSGLILDTLDQLLARGGIGVPAYGNTGLPFVYTKARSGTILKLLGDAVHYTMAQAAWTPTGLRVSTVDVQWNDEFGTLETFDEFSSLKRSANVTKIVNDVLLTEGTPVTDYRATWPDSVDLYGRKPMEYDFTDWYIVASVRSTVEGIIQGRKNKDASYAEKPMAILDASGPIKDTRHRIARLLPFDEISDGTHDDGVNVEQYRVVRVLQNVTVDQWTVSVEGTRLATDGAS